jgi:hypothetical protein
VTLLSRPDLSFTSQSLALEIIGLFLRDYEELSHLSMYQIFAKAVDAEWALEVLEGFSRFKTGSTKNKISAQILAD